MAIRWRRGAGRITWLAPAILVAALVCLTNPGFAADPLEVGRYSCPDHLEVIGTTKISAKRLAHALKYDPEIIWAGHPHAVMSLYRDTIRRRAEIALQHLGFPDAQVTTRLDLQAEKVIVDVVEGRPFPAGVIRVAGAAEATARQIAAALREPYPPEDAIPAPGEGSSAPRATRWLDRDGLPVELLEPLWKPGSPAPFDAPTQAVLRRQVERALAAAGRDNARFTVDLIRDGRRGAADLLVSVSDEGSVGNVAEIVLQDGPRDSREDVLSYLGLKLGQPITELDRLRMEHRLRSSGRFISQRVTTRRTVKGHGVVVSIELHEYAPASPLAKPLSAEEQALLACREWFLRMGEDGYDLKYAGPARAAHQRDSKSGVAVRPVSKAGHQKNADAGDPAALSKASFSPPIGDFIWSRHGLLVTFGDQPRRRITCVVSPGQVGCYLPGGEGSFLLPVASDLQLTTSLRFALNEEFDGTDKAEDSRPFKITFGVGTESLDHAGSGPPLKLDVRCEPVFFIASAHERQPRFEWQGRVLTVHTRGGRARIDADSGRLVEFSGRDDDGTEHRVTSEKGELARRLAELQAASGKNRFNADRPVSSLLAFAGSPAVIQCVQACLSSAEKTGDNSLIATTLSGLEQLAREGAFRPLDEGVLRRKAEYDAASRDAIAIPMSVEEREKQTPARQLATVGLFVTDRLFERDSWASTLGRAAACFAAGEVKYFAYDSLTLYQSEDMGPIGCLMLATCAPMPSIGARFAQKGGDRLSVESFRRDCQLFITALDRINCLESAVAAARVLTPEQAAAVGRHLLEDDRAAAEMVRYLRSKPTTKDAVAALPKALDLLWEQGLKSRVAEALQSKDPELAARPRNKQ